MLFNSYLFVLVFLPISIVGYFWLNRKNNLYAKVFLIGMSLWFYAYFKIEYIWIIIAITVVDYLFGNALSKETKHGTKNLLIWASLILNVGILFYFKYFDFLINNLNLVFHTGFSVLGIALPLGISFITFQQVAYLVDCYRGDVKKYSFLDYALFVTFFPKIIEGPICYASEIIPQFQDKKNFVFNEENFNRGLYGFTIGLAKKVLIADLLGTFVDAGYADIKSLSSLMAILVMIAYTLQLYFDFSGYCDMANGISKMFNINLPINFDSPYKALDIQDFWKRWHITLTRFFTKYLYIPLGGNRRGTFRTYLNILIIFTVSGLWHGANYTFILWGMLHGFAMMFTRYFKPAIQKIPAFIRWLITFIFINLTWIVFRADSIHSTKMFFSRLVKGGMSVDITLLQNLIPKEFSFINQASRLLTMLTTQYMPIVAAVFLVLLVLICVFKKNTSEMVENFHPTVGRVIISVVLLVWAITSFAGVSTFLYSNF